MPRPLRLVLRQLGDLALGIFVTVAMFLLAEAFLRLTSKGDNPGGAPTPRHLAAGFDEEAEVFSPDPEHPGGWRGNYSHSQARELAIPPKGGARRVLLFGGSNVANMPEQRLENVLNALGEGEYEVRRCCGDGASTQSTDGEREGVCV